MDNIDKRIITKLIANARISNVAIAEYLCMSPAAVYKRIKKLEKKGIIKNYTTILDKEKLNFTIQIILYITLDGQNSEKLYEFEKEVQKINNIISCHLISGDYDYLLHIVIKDIASYDKIYHDKIVKLPYIKNIKSNVIIREILNSSQSFI